ncbi:hypothetical protein [Nakamurella deserti]|uniref:hypothetical protein n=1 Tax=Nakamurella deserti TaxID=2164074 RepID=UPI000DBE9F17|nr:hypothetical protein [Nakamurella deserti]
MTSSSGFGSTGTPSGIPDLPPPPAPSTWQAPSSTPLSTGTSGSGGSTTDVAKDQAASVAGSAKDAAKDVAGTAKEQVSQVTGEAKKQAKDLFGQTRSELTEQASTQQQRVAGGLHSVSDQLRSLANGEAQQGPTTDLAHQAADKVQEIASFFENRDPGQLLDEVRRYAQRRPGMFLALSLGAGVLAGRLTRGLTADDSSSSDAPRTGGTAQVGGTVPRPALGTPAYGTPAAPAYGTPAAPAYGTPAWSDPGVPR